MNHTSRPAPLILLAALAILPGAAKAQSYKSLHTFKGNPDGANPHAAVIIGKDGALYGTTYVGGTSQSGTVYELTKATGEPWKETVLYSLGGPNGSYPRASLVFGNEGKLYGTTASGAIFELTPPTVAGDDWTETVLYTFGVGAGNIPDGAVLIGPSGTLYTTTQGYAIPGATAVALTPPATPMGAWTESVMYSFAGAAGSNPFAGLVAEGGTLYGTDYYEGDEYCQCGVVFQLTPPRSSGGTWTETTIHTFTGNDGAGPLAALTMGPGGTLFGTTVSGGSGVCPTGGGGAEPCGTVFQMVPPTAPGGTWTESVIYNFTGTNGDGAAPVSSAVLGANGALYGTTQYGGSTSSACQATFDNLSGCGTVFQLTPPTTPAATWTETVLHNFTGQNGDGAMPLAGLALSSTGVLYGTTSAGGAGASVVFSIKP